ncbi:MAG: hypothetical protein A2252_02560 [Elusimicrobia bacterium RIFOXYA2_FULL_39_19]|nr:MAG: hypothetical protein A2252_02560 [Elusimicrobia bacterium RIFOXYA2_FULL_39_19]
MNIKPKIAILGGGAWGTTLGTLLAKKNYQVSVWEIIPEKCMKMQTEKKLEIFGGAETFTLEIPSTVKFYNDINKAVEGKNIIMLAVPSHCFLDTVQKLKNTKIDINKCIFLSVVKGIKTDSLKRMTQLLKDELKVKDKNICVLSGPSFAIEVAKGYPTAVVAASTDSRTSKTIQNMFMTHNFRVYTHDDVIGVEIGGSLKNVIAIACGLSDNLQLGDNTKSALVTRGLREMIMLGNKLGGKTHTFMGLAGLGDLITTCFSRHSRNRNFGEKIGMHINLNKALNENITTTEGYRTAKSAYLLGKKYKIELPIINEIYTVIYKNKSPEKAVRDLMTRKPKSEEE